LFLTYYALIKKPKIFHHIDRGTFLVKKANQIRGDEAKRLSGILGESKSKVSKGSSASTSKAALTKLSSSEKSGLVKDLVTLFREAVMCMKGQVLVITSTELNGPVTKTLRKCTDAKSAITAFKDSHVELKEVIKAIAAAERRVGFHIFHFAIV
jgi:hypothetical protein